MKPCHRFVCRAPPVKPHVGEEESLCERVSVKCDSRKLAHPTMGTIAPNQPVRLDESFPIVRSHGRADLWSLAPDVEELAAPDALTAELRQSCPQPRFNLGLRDHQNSRSDAAGRPSCLDAGPAAL